MFDTSAIIEEYNNGASMRQLGFKYNCKPTEIKRLLVDNGIKVRNRYEQMMRNLPPQNRPKYTINDNYFDIIGPNQAYLLGFYAADGCVSKTKNLIKLVLAAVDYDFLNSIKEELQSSAPIKHYTTAQGYQNCAFQFSSAKIKQAMVERGIVPNKTYQFTIDPSIVPKEYMIDFIRGYFDGDGSVSTAGQSAFRWQICSFQYQPLKFIIDFLYEEYDIPKVTIYRRNNTYYFQYSNNSTRQIFKILYRENSLFLPRKYEKFKALVMK